MFARLSLAVKRRLTDYLDLDPLGDADDSLRISQSIEALKERLGVILAARRRLELERAALGETPADLSARAEQAISLGRDDLARTALRYRAQTTARGEPLERELAALAFEAQELEALLDASGPSDRLLAKKLAELDGLLADAAAAAEKER
ncbi:MAG: hypothetical protein U5J99_00800 [Parvularculaceae bacterium]|nr:hypothetical protein [Parvularculaceae bacterium]